MPSVKIPKKSTDTDMTPFVDVAFLILSFFMLATKFKPPEPLTITTPASVSSTKLKQTDHLMIQFDSGGHVLFSINLEKADDNIMKEDVLKRVNTSAKLGLTDADVRKFVRTSTIGVPMAELKTLYSLPEAQFEKANTKGIPVDSANNELQRWLQAAAETFTGRPIDIMIKGDNNAKYPNFKGVIEALRANNIFKYKLITDPKGVPEGTELYKLRQQGKGLDKD